MSGTIWVVLLGVACVAAVVGDRQELPTVDVPVDVAHLDLAGALFPGSEVRVVGDCLTSHRDVICDLEVDGSRWSLELQREGAEGLRLD